MTMHRSFASRTRRFGSDVQQRRGMRVSVSSFSRAPGMLILGLGLGLECFGFGINNKASHYILYK